MSLSVHQKSLSTSTQYFDKSFILIYWTSPCPLPNRPMSPTGFTTASFASSSSFMTFYAFVPRAKLIIITLGLIEG